MRHRASAVGTTRTARSSLPKATRPAGDTSRAATYSGVLADVHPDEPLNDLHRTVRAAIQAVRGPHATGYPSKVPHLTIGYAASECDSDQVQRKLRNEVRPGHAPMHVEAVHLVDVNADAQAKTIRWDDVARIPLGTML
ncbi:2'-5' RNA ligase family protein [Embleya sp. MST-111070]|uniref:2'-5' RNA ligase family protein n=1 Tax=Embleya sp. MST-111070 TaxID=3398231 RepID=UPI003F73E086